MKQDNDFKRQCRSSTLFGWTGEPPELWHVASREPKEHWSTPAKLIFNLCTTVVRLSYQLVSKCSEKVADSLEAASKTLLPMYIFPTFYCRCCLSTMDSLTATEVSRWHKRLHGMQRFLSANTLTTVLRPAISQPKPAAEPRQFLRFAKGQLVGLLASEEESLRGGEGGREAFCRRYRC